MGNSAAALIEQLGLEPHPEEGGWFREVYRAAEEIDGAALPGRYGSARRCATAIYYLLTPDTFSAMHRVASDEIFHFYDGDPVEQLRLHPDGTCEVVTIGRDIAAGQSPMTVVPHGVWQGARLVAGGAWALLGATVAPGFEYADYEHGDGTELAKAWPGPADMIEALST